MEHAESQREEAPYTPLAFPFIGHAPYFMRDKLGFLTRCAAGGSSVVRLRLGGLTYLLNDAEDVRHVLVTNQRNYDKSPRIVGSVGKRLFGRGLLAAPSGAAHLRERRALLPLFHHQTVSRFAAPIVDCAMKRLAGWPPGSEMDVAEEMMALARLVMVRTMFGELSDSRLELIGSLFEIRRRYIARVLGTTLPFAEWWPDRLTIAYRGAARRLEQIITEAISTQRAEERDVNSMLAMLVRASYENGMSLDDGQIRDEVLNLTLAGYETLGVALAWIWYLLARNPCSGASLTSELRTVLGGRHPGHEDLPRLKYTAMVLAETMRLYPPTWLFVRVARGRDELPSGSTVERGAKIYLSPYLLHHNPRYFPDPARFSPERFAGGEDQRRPRFAYFPFGGGPRVCIGESFATMEGVLLSACVAQTFELALVDGTTVDVEAGITLRPRNGLRMRVLRRDPA